MIYHTTIQIIDLWEPVSSTDLWMLKGLLWKIPCCNFHLLCDAPSNHIFLCLCVTHNFVGFRHPLIEVLSPHLDINP